MQLRSLLILLILLTIGCPTMSEPVNDDDSSESETYLSCADRELVSCWVTGNPANGRPACAETCDSCPSEDDYWCSNEHPTCEQEDQATCWYLGDSESMFEPVCAETCSDCPGRDDVTGDGHWCG